MYDIMSVWECFLYFSYDCIIYHVKDQKKKIKMNKRKSFVDEGFWLTPKLFAVWLKITVNIFL